MSDRHETYRDCRATIPLLVQKILDPDVVPIMCYEPLNVQNRMCELCTFSQIRSHISIMHNDISSTLHIALALLKLGSL